MALAAIHKLTRTLNPERFTGPILGKELRVLSRRKRYYLLRFLYVAALAIFVGVQWAEITSGMGRFSAGSGGRGYTISRMAEAGKGFAMSVAWFQFAAVHVLTPTLLAGAIREELRRRTLNTLMTTPITGGQIVVGKLFSKLLPVLLALGMSLPVMAAARILGGVPWSFVLATTCISAAAAVLIGSLCLLFGAGGGGFFSVLFPVALVYGAPIVVLGSLLGFILEENVTLVSPFWAMVGQEEVLQSAGRTSIPWWPYHCILMLTLSVGVLALAAKRARRTALQAADLATLRAEQRRRRRQRQTAVGLRGAREVVRNVRGAPLIWKELRFYIPGTRKNTIMAAVLVLALIGLLYVLGITRDDSDILQLPYMMLYFLLATTVTVAMAAGTISSERESRALALLLSVPVSDGYIVSAKLLGVLYRAIPPWAAIVLHTVIFSIAGVLRPVVILHVVLIALAMIPFLSGLGMYLSSHCRSSANAAVLAILVCVLLWGVMPGALTAAVSPWDHGQVAQELTAHANPFLQLIASVRGAVIEDSWLARRRQGYEWPGAGLAEAGEVTRILLVSFLLYGLAGAVLLMRAKHSLRRMAFED